jgi:uncharacterized membrane protein (UPF0127 family)
MLALLLASALACQPAPSAVDPTPKPAAALQPAAAEPAQNPPTAPPAQSQEKAEKRRFISARTFQLDDLEVAKVKIGEHEFKLWVMDTYAKRMEGMMFLQNADFKDDEGMIFVFDRAEYQRFWMRNTLVPLDIAYVDARKRIINIYTMKALDEVGDYSSRAPAQFVIELRAGMMAKKQIKAGMVVEIPATVKSKD